MSAASMTVGVDIGGSTYRVGLVEGSGRLIAKVTGATSNLEDAGAFLRVLEEDICRLTADDRRSGVHRLTIGIALPGTLNEDRSRVVRCVNLPFFEGAAIVEELVARLDASVLLMTDAEAATWGEFAVLDPSPARFAHLRLGTGVACGVVRDGRVVRLDLKRATHLPALVVDAGEGAAACPCGLRGCLETIAAGPAIVRRAMERGIAADLSTLERKCHNGDTSALALLDEIASAVGCAVMNLGHAYGVTQVSLGGGVLALFPYLRRRVTGAGAGTKGLLSDIDVALFAARLGDDAGLLGAARLARKPGALDGPPTSPTT